MASVKRRPDGKYRVRWYDLSGKEHAKHFTKSKDAKAFAATIEADKLRGQYVDPTDKTTVAAYTRRYVATRRHNPRTARRVASLIKNHIEGVELGAQRLSRVLPSDAQAWVTDRSRVLAPSSLANLVYLVRSVFTSAALDRLIGSSPFVKISMPETQQARIVPLTVAQVRELAEKMPAHVRAMVIVQAGLGLRLGELLALRACDVDFLRRTAHVETQIPPGQNTREKPKTPMSIRQLPLPQFVADALAAHMAAYAPAPDGSLFYTGRKHPYTHTHYMSYFRPAATAAGLPPGTTPHDLRHHYASVLLYAGESVIAVAERLGHKNANLVLSTYGHLMPDSEERTRKALDGAWSAPADALTADAHTEVSGGNADQVRTAGKLKAV